MTGRVKIDYKGYWAHGKTFNVKRRYWSDRYGFQMVTIDHDPPIALPVHHTIPLADEVDG